MESFFFRVVSAQWLASIVQQPAASVRSCKGITYEEKGRDGEETERDRRLDEGT